MSKRFCDALVACMVLWASDSAHAQRATEIYIPIGLSPGLSGRHTSIGTIVKVDAQAQTLTLRDAAGEQVVHCTDATRVWFDRTQKRLSNGDASLADCRAGWRCEIKYVKNQKQDSVAEWIKVELGDGD